MIDREHPLSVVRQAKLLNISRGAVYYRPRRIGISSAIGHPKKEPA
jgi:putative transposase